MIPEREKKKRGRPRKSSDDTLDATVSLYITKREADALYVAARRLRVSVSRYVRAHLFFRSPTHLST